MKVLGIDPGIDRMGFAVAEIHGATYTLLACGVVTTDRAQTTAQRLSQIRADILEILAAHSGIEAAGIEELFFSKNVTTAGVVWQARGVIVETLQSAGIPELRDITPNQVKMAVTGQGNAQKFEVQKMVALTFGLAHAPQPDDAADAAAVALATASLFC